MALTLAPSSRWSFGLLALALAFGAGCGGAQDEGDQPSTEGALATATFVPMLKCDDGAAVLDQARETVDVNSVEAGRFVMKKQHALQFVVRDRAIVERMKAKVPHLGSGSDIVLRGSLLQGATFDFFEDWSMGQAASRLEGKNTRIREQLGAVVHRVHGEDDKVRLVFNRTRFIDTCASYFDETHCAPRDGQQVNMQTQRQDEPIVEAVFRCVAP